MSSLQQGMQNQVIAILGHLTTETHLVLLLHQTLLHLLCKDMQMIALIIGIAIAIAPATTLENNQVTGTQRDEIGEAGAAPDLGAETGTEIEEERGEGTEAERGKGRGQVREVVRGGRSLKRDREMKLITTTYLTRKGDKEMKGK